MPKPIVLRTVNPFHDDETPMFNGLYLATGQDQQPTFEPHETHEEFMLRHAWPEWLYETIHRKVIK